MTAIRVSIGRSSMWAAVFGFIELISTVLAALRGMVLLGFVSPEDRDAAYAAGRRHLLDMIAAWEPGS